MAAAAGTGFRAGNEASVRRLRSAYMLAPEVRYLNHASIGTVPRAVHEAHAAYLALCETRPSLYVWGAPWREATEETRRAAARLLGAEPEDLAITHNTTEGFNVLAHGLPLDPGDEVLFSSLNHPGASVPWTALAPRRGYTVRRFHVPVERVPEMTEEEVVELHLAALSERTRALVVPHVDNQVGLRHPLRLLAEAARARGVRWILVDGAQSAGMIPVGLAGAGVDAYAMSPHKWIQSPKGLGLLWVSPGLRPSLPRMWHRREDAGREPSARKYEDYSTRAWPGVVALGDAVDFQLALGEEEKERRRRAVRARIKERVEAEPGLAWASPASWELGSAIVAVRVRGRSAPEVGRLLLREHGVDTRAFGPPLDTLRLSPDVSTPLEEIDAVLDRMAAAARP
jgi:selenocysteine lyase/cysteine desulfurase